MQRTRRVLEEGEKIEVILQPPGGRGMTFRPKLMNLEPNREMRWLGRLFMPGLFEGEHIFELHPADDDGTRFVQRECVRGLRVRPLLAMIGDKTLRGFQQMNEALKARAEEVNSH